MFECPNCGEKTIKKWTKFCMGPIRSTRCSHCGVKLSVPYKSLYIISALLILIYASPRLGIRGISHLILMSFYGFIGTYGYYKFVPLIVKLEEGDAGYKEQRRNNTFHGLAYFVVTFGAMIALTI
ncbi:hypothetical protein EZV73_21170 [Acidaminobacter sp. JC074]|uniref:CpXC domain-containing protein n=1 Tax=Acidaminobacter sp. JC074 TaxID=2530199 RepID=UPI001F0DB7CA|nr:CpXC domain-containing protein [Acidaminobacter sp. JC074]MCH4890105.1 hypothetical protein [Acidaminobacter sp. JC074]